MLAGELTGVNHSLSLPPLSQKSPDSVVPAMRIRLSFDPGIGVPEDLSRVWYYINPLTIHTIADLAKEIGKEFGVNSTFGFEFEGYMLLGHHLCQHILVDGSLIRVMKQHRPLQPPKMESSNRRLSTKSGSPPSPSYPSSSRHNTFFEVDYEEDDRDTQMEPHPGSNANSFSRNSIPVTVELDYENESRDGSSESSDSESEDSVIEQHATSMDIATTAPTSASSVSIELAPSSKVDLPSRKDYLGRPNKRNRQLMRLAKQDQVQNVSHVYTNHIDSKDSASASTDYDSLPTVNLQDLKIGQIVAWKSLVLGPFKTPEFAPWQERQLMAIRGNTYTFRVHNISAYLDAWWYSDEGQKVCTVKQWLEESGQKHESHVSITEATNDFDLIKLVHDVD